VLFFWRWTDLPARWRGTWRLIWLFVAGLTMLLLGWIGYAWFVRAEPGDPFLSAYDGEVLIDPIGKQMTGIWKWEGINRSDRLLNEVVFHVYPRQFQPDMPTRGRHWEPLLGEERLPGRYEIQRVVVNGRPVSYRLEGTLLYLDELNWRKKEKLQVVIHFLLRLPKNEGRLSYDQHAIWLGNWSPQLAVYERGTWHAYPYYPIGDPFYSRVADYRLKVSLPQGYTLITTGHDLLQGTPYGEWVQYEVSARRVRDFAMVVVDQQYAYLQEQVGNVTVNTWFLTSDDVRAATRLHQVAVQALQFYQEKFGPYPYEEFDVVRTSGFFGGMEYPGLAFVRGKFFEHPEDRYGTVVVAHETAHQWWYVAVGSDQVGEAWLDESLSEFSTMWFLSDIEPEYGQLYIAGKERYVASPPGDLKEKSGPVRRPLWEFADWETYDYDVYQRGAMALWRVYQQLGADKMMRFLQEYYREYQFREATGSDFQRLMIRHFGRERWEELAEQLQ